MASMLSHPDSPYIRCTGFLYLRFAAEPSTLWKWFEPYLYDEEPVQITSQGSKQQESTIGQYVRDLLTDMNYYGTLLPRLPVAIERDIKCKLLLAEKNEVRAKRHLQRGSGVSGQAAVDHFEEGARVRALYGDEENPVAWYDAVIDRVLRRDEETGEELLRPKYWVTFLEYGNTELVTLGELDLPSSSLIGGSNETYRQHPQSEQSYKRDYDRGKNGDEGNYARGSSYRGYPADRGYGPGEVNRRSHDRGYDASHRDDTKGCDRGYDRSSSYNDSRYVDSRRAEEGDLMEEVLRREREKIAAKGTDYARRPPTFKSSVAVKQAYGSSVPSTGKRSRSRSRERDEETLGSGKRGATDDDSKQPAADVPQNTEKTAEELAAIAEKKRKLLQKYG